MGRKSFIVVDTSGITIENAVPDRREVVNAIEMYAIDKLGELGVDVTEADITKTVVEKKLQFVELKSGDTKFVAYVTDHFSEPDDGLSIWVVELRQY
jgi:hypothetical protein